MKRWFGIFGVMLAITVSHYALPPSQYLWHEILERLYYLPIVFAAIAFGRLGGVVAAICAIVCYIPHILASSNGSTQLMASKYAEMVIFLAVGIVTGILADRERRRAVELEASADELRTTHAELKSSVNQLRQADRLLALGQLVAGLAHEIRNPLGSIEGAVDICRRTASEEKRVEFFGIIKKEVARLNNLLSSLLDFARTRTPQMHPSRIESVLESVVTLVTHSAHRKGISIVTNVPPGLPDVECDTQQIQQALLNVAINAIQATGPGGAVRISVSEQDGWITLAVHDQGPGIAETDLNRIFDPFFTTKDGGTGLGLAISYQILLQHAGQILARPNTDVGMTFTLTFPVRPKR